MILRSRPLRTYSRRDGFVRLLRPAGRWISPPLNSRNLFSSSSASASAMSGSTSASADPSDDRDYSPPFKRRPGSDSDSLAEAPQMRMQLRPRRKRSRRAGSGAAGRARRDTENRAWRDTENWARRDTENRAWGKENRARRDTENWERRDTENPAWSKENRARRDTENRAWSKENRARRDTENRARGKENRARRDTENRTWGKENRPRGTKDWVRGKENRPRGTEDRVRGKENRPPLLSSPCPFPPPSRGSPWRRRRRGPAPLCSTPQTPAPLCRTPQTPAPLCRTPQTPAPLCRTPQTPVPLCSTPQTPAPLCRAPQTPVPLCSTPQTPAPAWPRRPAPPLSSTTDNDSPPAWPRRPAPPLSSTTDNDSLPARPRRPALQLSSITDNDSLPARPRRPALQLSSLLLSTTVEDGLGPGAPALRRHPPLPPSSAEECPGQSPLPCPAHPSCRTRAAPSPQDAPGEPKHPAPCGRDASEDRSGETARGGWSWRRDLGKEYQLVPVVVLDPLEVPMRLASMKLNRQADVPPACQQPASPVGCPGILKHKWQRAEAAPGEGSPCRRACISGISASRWHGLQPKGHKHKRQEQQPKNRFSRAQARQKPAQEGVLESSADVRDNDSLFLNCSWARARASLSFHKKKKVTTDSSFCSISMLSTPEKSQLSGYQASCSSGRAQRCFWSASSVVLLAPGSSAYVLELMLTDAEKVFGECQQEGPIPFEDCIPLDKMKTCKKIGEGVFGEVFRIDSERGPVALKIIPIEGTEKVNGEAQKSFGEILPEIIISKELSLLSEESVNRTVGFISLYSVHCVQGAYPKHLLKAWDKYHKETGSNNDRPDFFGDEQLFMVLEFEFGGRDLSCMRRSFSSVTEARSILHQVTASLAVAEQELHFEHRDLHWGNVLVKTTNEKALHYMLNGATHTIPTAGIQVCIIDCTLSRLEKDGLTVFCDLATEEELFQGTGDYQFDIYRQMKAENSNNWTGYHPHSNVLWLHYLADKLLNDMCYKKKASTRALKNIKMQLTKFHKEVLTFESAHDVLQNSSLFQ